MLPSKNRLLSRLALRGLTVKSWAEQEGFLPNSAVKVINRYAGTKDQPRGKVSRAIVERLLEVMR